MQYTLLLPENNMKENSIMSLTELYELFVFHPKITTDSRNCPAGSLFFALKGTTFDGNEFAEKALNRGCAYAIIDDPKYFKGERTILVDDVLTTLQELGQRHRKMFNIPVISITGTNGKTTTKELVASVLATKYEVLYTEGNLNNHIGVPLTLLRLNHDHEIAVIEMGANHPGEIKALVNMAMPTYGLITNVGYAHLEGFGSFAGVVKTKGEMYDYLRQTKGKIFIHKGNKDLEKIGAGIEQITYGEEEDCFASGHVVESNPFLAFNWKQQGKIHTVETHLVGAYNLENVLAAVAVGRYFKVPAERISRAIAGYEPNNNRSQRKQTGRNDLVIDAYNANPSSMKAALANFSAMQASPKAVILGDMLELGSESAALHAEILDLVESMHFEKAIFCGEQFASLAGAKGYPCFKNKEELAVYLTAQPLEGYHILLKGSHGLALEKVLDLL